MARFEVRGFGDLIADIASLAKLPEEAMDDMLHAEADVVEPAIKAKAEAYGVKDTGMTVESIKRGKAKKSPDGRTMLISPQGTRKRGNTEVRNAEIAFINEYGRGTDKQIQPARPFMRDAVAESEDEAVEAAQKVYDEYLKSKNF